MPAAATTPTAVAESFLEAIVSGDPDRVAAHYAASVEVELPFGPPLLAGRTASGRDPVRAQLEASRDVRRYLRVEDAAIHAGADGETVLVEYTLHGEHLPGGAPFALRFAMVMTVRDGVIVHSRDYTDPVAAALLMGRGEELAAHLAGA
ncbi:hypothetical protein DSM104299_01939 [Baekduia alba]|uniref:nuclear transport factor 2 family protein n=1 Tax=Baekduia alba TaxID=2997333 RepID=UPI0023410345|nr:nuclear transport factor 2 family protein [Baekduia alba]WCB93232.1 hypothetical protein DSM104299_01939 [Baekduia alba]